MTATDTFEGLIDGLKNGDGEAARVLYDRYICRMMGLAVKRLPAYVRTKEGEDDIAQAAMITFVKRFAAGEFEPGNWDELWVLLAYLTRCKVGRAIRKYQTKKRRDEIEAVAANGDRGRPDPADRGPRPDEAAELTDTIDWVMSRLNERARSILSLKLLGHNVSEIATAVGRKQSTVFRVLREIRNVLCEKTGLELRDLPCGSGE